MTQQTRHVLVVDDDELARLEISRCVEQQGHTVGSAKDGAECIEMLRSEMFNLVLLDLLMPEIDGFEVLRQMREDPTLREIPVIVITAVEESDSVRTCIELGAVGHLTKPVDAEMLAARISANFA